jgi:hypothetical protein
MVFSFFLSFFPFFDIENPLKFSKKLLAQLVKFSVGENEIPKFPKLIYVKINDKFGYKQKNLLLKKKTRSD